MEQFARVKQPTYIRGNVYLNGADVFERENDYYRSDRNPDVKIVEEESEVYLEITLPEEALKIPTEIITTEILGMVRIVELRYENPDGSALSLNRDLTGDTRTAQPKAGPIENLHGGKNKIKVWTR